MLRYLPLLLAAAAVATAASLDFLTNSDIAGQTEAWAEALENGVPSTVGSWVGIDMPVDEESAIVAGAVGHISRRYQHQETGRIVDLWLIVGHMQGVARHTPNICYRVAGFRQQEQQRRYRFEIEGQPPAEFWTAWFERTTPTEGTQRRRVFWGWTLPKKGEPITWKAPREARYEYSGAKSLFKMYFTTGEPEDERPLEENPANELAEQLIPVIAELLEKGIDGAPGVGDDATEDEAEAA